MSALPGPTPPWLSQGRASLTLSWLNLSRSLSQLPVKEDRRRRCSERLSEPARVEAWGCAGMLIPCWRDGTTNQKGADLALPCPPPQPSPSS